MAREPIHTLVVARPVGILSLIDARPVMAVVREGDQKFFELNNLQNLEVDGRTGGVTKARVYLIGDSNREKVYGVGETQFVSRSMLGVGVDITIIRDTAENIDIRMSSIENGVRI